MKSLNETLPGEIHVCTTQLYYLTVEIYDGLTIMGKRLSALSRCQSGRQDKTLVNGTDKSASPLSAAWLAAGSALFGIALGTPLLVLNYLPDPRAKSEVQQAAASIAAQPLINQADDAPDYPEMTLASNAEPIDADKLGSLATLIDAQGESAQSVNAPEVRRMILEAVTVDLESSVTVDALEHLHFPIRDCEAPKHASGATRSAASADIEAALYALQGLPVRVPYKQIAGPLALDRTARFEGMSVELCHDLTRISAVEILPLSVEAEPSAIAQIASPGMPVIVEAGPTLRGTNQLDEGVATQLVAVPEKTAYSMQPSAPSRPGSEFAVNGPKVATRLAIPVQSQPSPHERTKVLVLSDPVPSRPSGPKQSLTAASLQAGQNTSGAPAKVEIGQYQPSSLLALHGRAFEISQDLAFAKAQEALQGSTDRPSSPVLAVAAPLPVSQAVPAVNASDALSEERLNLDRRARRQAQIRLALLGHDPKGIDGIFGNGTRSAIAALQTREALVPTGYLDALTLAVLNEKSELNYANWRARRAKQRATRVAQNSKAEGFPKAPQRIASSPPARRAPACARDTKGVIISNQSFDCDLNVLRESLGSLFGTAG